MHCAGTKQHALRLFFFAGDDVHQPVDAVAEIDVDDTALPIEQLCTRRAPLGGVARQILLPAVCLCFSDALP